MRTKAIILSAMVGIAGVASSFAQNVYSVNVVGYINLSVPAGFSIVANQLDNGNGNLVTELLPALPSGLTVWKFNGVSYDQLSWIAFGGGAGVWAGVDTMTLEPGESAFFQADAAMDITFVGEVQQGLLVTPLVTGFNLVSSAVPQAGTVETDLGFTPSFLDTVWVLNSGGGYDQFSYIGFWTPEEPSFAVGQGFWIQSVDDKSWTRDFTVN